MENLVDDNSSEGVIITFPDENSDGDLQSDFQLELAPEDDLQSQLQNVTGLGASDTVKFEQSRMMNSSKSKIVTNGFSSEQVRRHTFELDPLLN